MDSHKDLPEATLLPRRREILEVIRDQRLVTFDQIRRRFMRVPPSTLHFDMKKLVEGRFIRKLGVTRGACYEPVT